VVSDDAGNYPVDPVHNETNPDDHEQQEQPKQYQIKFGHAVERLATACD
jgi:hypothetical protein